eukprot:s1545_g1.t1
MKQIKAVDVGLPTFISSARRIYDALVSPLDEFRKVHMVVKGLVGLAPGRGHALRGRVVWRLSFAKFGCHIFISH